MYLQIATQLNPNPRKPLLLKIGIAPTDQRDDGVFARLPLTHDQLVSIRDAITSYLEVEQYYQNNGSVYQEEIG